MTDKIKIYLFPIPKKTDLYYVRSGPEEDACWLEKNQVIQDTCWAKGEKLAGKFKLEFLQKKYPLDSFEIIISDAQ